MVRDGGHGGSDIYISFKQQDGTWSPATNMGSPINTDLHDTSPQLSHDGKYLFFSRGEWQTKEDGERNWVGKMFWVDALVIESVRPKQQAI